LFGQSRLLFILAAMPWWIKYRLTDGRIYLATSDALARVEFSLSFVDIICENATWMMSWVALFGSLVESVDQSLGENLLLCIIRWGFSTLFEKSESGVRAMFSFNHLGLLFDIKWRPSLVLRSGFWSYRLTFLDALTRNSLFIVAISLFQTVWFILVFEIKILFWIVRRGFSSTYITSFFLIFFLLKPLDIFRTLRSRLPTFLNQLRFNYWLSAVFENSFFLKCNISQGHYHPCWNFFQPHNLHDMLFVLL